MSLFNGLFQQLVTQYNRQGYNIWDSVGNTQNIHCYSLWLWHSEVGFLYYFYCWSRLCEWLLPHWEWDVLHRANLCGECHKICTLQLATQSVWFQQDRSPCTNQYLSSLSCFLSMTLLHHNKRFPDKVFGSLFESALLASLRHCSFCTARELLLVWYHR